MHKDSPEHCMCMTQEEAWVWGGTNFHDVHVIYTLVLPAVMNDFDCIWSYYGMTREGSCSTFLPVGTVLYWVTETIWWGLIRALKLLIESLMLVIWTTCSGGACYMSAWWWSALPENIVLSTYVCLVPWLQALNQGRWAANSIDQKQTLAYIHVVGQCLLCNFTQVAGAH